MKLFTCTSFTGYWPVGVSAMVFAHGPLEAANLLETHLDEIGLPQVILPSAMAERPANPPEPCVIILQDGNY